MIAYATGAAVGVLMFAGLLVAFAAGIGVPVVVLAASLALIAGALTAQALKRGLNGSDRG